MVKTKAQRWYSGLLWLAVIFAFIVVLLGAYTRLQDAGLGCPDWPGCYGHLAVPQSHSELASVAQQYPGVTVEPQKAWIEMTHRYFAGSLGLLIIILALWGIFQRRRLQLPIVLPILLIGMIVFQAALGMWTVTLKLMPLIVMGHLLGGFTLLSLLWLSGLYVRRMVNNRVWSSTVRTAHRLLPWAVLGLIILILQIALGGWTSSNYAALVCPGLPLCHGNTLLPLDFHQAFTWWTPFEQLSYGAKMAIQMTHRFGALITFCYWMLLALVVVFKCRAIRASRTAKWIIFILCVQVILGLLNIIWVLPLGIAVAHNGVAALLLLSVITLVFRLAVPTP